MGPPKYCPPRITHDQRMKRYDYFEYRYNRNDRAYYLFNPYTGETIFGTDTNYMDRRKSMWATPDKEVSDSTVFTVLYPEYYTSKRWGKRPFHGWTTNCLCMSFEEQLNRAAVHIGAVYRGFVARQSLRR